jgi:photosystem II stability/assembly factor-like uncharacterized protein
MSDRGHTPNRLRRALLGAPLALLLVAACALLAGGPASAATSSSVVTANVLSAVTLGNGCTAATGWNLGTVTPGVPATTDTGAGICSFTFGSSNDTAMLRMYQRDGAGMALVNRSDANATLQAGTGTSRLMAIEGVDTTPSTAWFSGGSGKLYKTTNSGATWTANTSGVALTLYGLAVSSTSQAYVAGDTSTLRRTLDGGTTWADACVPCPVVGTPAFYDIENFGTANMWAAGQNGTMIHSTNADQATPTWVAQTTGMPTSTVHSIKALSANTVYAVGGSGSVIVTQDGGTTWVTLTGAPNATYLGVDVAQSGGNDYIYIAAHNGLVVRGVRPTGSALAGGTTWTSLQADTVSRSDLESISVLTKDDVETVGIDGVGFRSADASSGSPTWTRQTLPETGNWYAVWRAPTGQAYAVSTGHVTAYSATGSDPWTKTVPGALSESANYHGIVMPTSTDGWVVGGTVAGASQVRHTIDGATWTAQTSNATKLLWDVGAWDTSRLVAVGAGGTVIRTTDGGTTWTPVASGTTDDLYNVVTVTMFDGTRRALAVGASGRLLVSNDAGATWTSSVISAACRMRGIATADGVVVWAGCHTGALWRSMDGGATWTSVANPVGQPIFAGKMTDSSTLYMTGSSGAVIASTNADAANPASVTFTSVYPHTTRNQGIDAYDAQHVGVAGESGTVFRTVDGTTWTDVPTGTSHDMYDIAMPDASRVWMVGENGRIYRSATTGSVTDYTPGTADWGSGAGTSTFGVCLQAVNVATTTAVWPVDTGNTSGLCQPLAGDAWQAVPTAASKVAKTTVAGATGRVDFVWGMRPSLTTTAGSYYATVTIEALAPDV